MAYYQVNQRETFHIEFSNGYLCSPVGGYAGWPNMPLLKKGDVIFHYNSKKKQILGLSVVDGNYAHIKFHRSIRVMSSQDKIKVSKYNIFQTIQVKSKVQNISISHNFFPNEQIYLKKISSTQLRTFSNKPLPKEVVSILSKIN